MHVHRVSFPNQRGLELSARLHRPAGTPVASAVFAHAFTAGKDLNAGVRIAETLADRGFAVLRFDFAGIGQSPGDFSDTTFSTNVGALVAAADFLRRESRAPALLIGHSLGGAAVLAAAPRIPEVAAVATIGAPADPVHLEHLFSDEVDDIERDGRAEVSIAGRRFVITREFLDDLEAQRLPESLAELGRALLVLHAPGDTIVGIDNARRLFEAARHPKSFVSLDDADHLVSREEDARYAGEVIAAWALPFVGARERAEATRGEGGVVCTTEAGGFRTKIAAGAHLLVADEPEAVGGTDTGPTPYDLLAAALGTCTSMTLRLYAERKGWPLERVEVSVRHERRHAEDCADCEKNRRAKIDVFARRVRLEGELTDDQRARLLEIAEKCPVHRTLTSTIHIETELA